MKKKVTLEFMYSEIKNGFENAQKDFTNIRVELKNGLHSFNTDFDKKLEDLAISIQNQFTEARQEANGRFDIVEARLDRIENVTLFDHTQQLERLRDNYLVLKTKVDRGC